MTTTTYVHVNDLLLNGLNLVGADLKIVLVDSADYIFSAAHTSLADVPAAARVATTGSLQNLAASGGDLTANDITIANVTGDTIEGQILYLDTGVEATSHLISFSDDIAQFIPNGSGVTLEFSANPTAAGLIFRLT